MGRHTESSHLVRLAIGMLLDAPNGDTNHATEAHLRPVHKEIHVARSMFARNYVDRSRCRQICGPPRQSDCALAALGSIYIKVIQSTTQLNTGAWRKQSSSCLSLDNTLYVFGTSREL